MKYVISLFIVVFFFFGLGSSFSLQEFLYPHKVYPSGTVVLHDRLHGVYLIKPKKRSFVFDTRGTTAQTLLTTHTGATMVVNGSYFGYSGGLFVPAGIYTSDPSPVDPTHCERDKNICELLNLDSLSFTSFQPVVKTPTVSAGPTLLNKGKIPEEIANRYSHRQTKAYRTALLNTKRWPLFVVTKKQYTLPRLATYIHKLFGNISAINLDGGSSTSLASLDDTATFERNNQKRLPTFFVLY